MKTNLEELEWIHKVLNWLFYRHQMAVLNQNKEEAIKLLEHHEELVKFHMGQEEEFLIPLYEKRCPPVRGGAPVIFTGEHQKIMELLSLFSRLATTWVHSNGPGQETLDLLDQEHRFKELMEHHDMRERKILLPEVERVTTEAEKQELLRRFTRTTTNFQPPSLTA